MDENFSAAKEALEKLLELRSDQINDQSVVQKLNRLNAALLQSWELSDQWFTGTKLSEFPRIFLKLCHAAESAKRTVDSTVDDYTQDILSKAIAVLCNASCASARFCHVFYENNISYYLIVILAEPFCDDGWDGERKKQLDYQDAGNCMLTLINAVQVEPALGEQLRECKCREVLEKYFTCERVDTAMQAFTLCSYIVANPSGSDFQVSAVVLEHLLKKLTETLFGYEENLRGKAGGLLSCLKRYILCSDDFNWQLIKCKAYDVLDLLSLVLAAPEPSDVADSLTYLHDKVEESDSNEPRMFTTYLEKEQAASVCMALLFSENYYHRNAYKMQKCTRLLAALKSAADKPNDKLRDVANSVLGQLQRRLPPNNNDADFMIAKSVTSVEQAPLKNYERNKSDASDSEKTSEHSDSFGFGFSTASAASDKSAKRTNDQHSLHESAVNQLISVDDNSVNVETQSTRNRKYVMLCFCISSKPFPVDRIVKSLQRCEIDTWCYEKDTSHDDVYTVMAKAIEGCAAVLALISEAFRYSDMCRQEFHYARELQKPIVIVRLEDFKPMGWLGLYIAGLPLHDFASFDADGGSYREKIANLIKHLSVHVKQLE